MSNNIRPFHVAFPVHDLAAAKTFFVNALGCSIGRTDERWIDFSLFGHQVTAHLVDKDNSEVASNPVDGKKVPASHWGVILEWEQWHELAERLKNYGVEFIIEPYIRFEGEVGEQATLFFLEPSGQNAMEFKAFKNDDFIFQSE